MKNVKRLMIAMSCLLGTTVLADNASIPSVLSSEDSPFRFTAGFSTNMHSVEEDVADEQKFGLKNMGGTLGFTHNVGFDFEYGLNVDLYQGSYRRLFTEYAKTNEKNGFGLNVNALARYMPELADGFNLGLGLGFGWGKIWNKGFDEDPEGGKKISFGGLNFHAGIPMSYRFTEEFAFYAQPNFVMTNINFYKDGASDELKKMGNLAGVEAPIGFVYNFVENTGVYLNVNNGFYDFSNFGKSYRVGGVLGVSYSI